MKYNNLIKEENARRLKAIKQRDIYDPIAGVGCYGRRVAVTRPDGTVYVPKKMIDDAPHAASLSPHDFAMLRQHYDFEYWCATCVTVKDKSGYSDIKLRLNRPQRLIFAEMERQRTADKPIRIVLLKARQVGGSTLVQAYMAWIQLMHRPNWNSIICAHLKEAAFTIRGMMTKILSEYPEEFLPDDVAQMRLKPFEGSRDTLTFAHRPNTVTITSAETRASARSKDLAMAHLSEVAFWRSSPQHDPIDIIRSISGSIALQSHTLVALESTANGTGNFFHNEWLRAAARLSDKAAVFIPWYESNIHMMTVTDPKGLCLNMDEYEQWLWDIGLSLEQIAWYDAKRREYSSHKAMMAEYPTTAEEAFNSTERAVFDHDDVAALRQDCNHPIAVGEVYAEDNRGFGALRNVHFVPSEMGKLKIWRHPAKGDNNDRYLVVVDVGGRSDGSDWSVITVFDRNGVDNKPEVVAEWRGHADHDILAWKAVMIAAYYALATLTIESNTLERASTEGENAGFILREIAEVYPNLYFRNSYDPTTGRRIRHPGFHTNRHTKPLIINSYIAAVRDRRYIEHSNDALNELLQYERRDDGSYGAKKGCHDDRLITRAIAMFILDELRGAEVEQSDLSDLKSCW